MSTDYVIAIEKFAEHHFIKSFKKKYKGAWDITWKAIEETFKRFDLLFDTSVAETIVDNEKVKICKTEFRVAGTKESRHGSGNRCIVAIQKNENIIRVLLVYHKNDLGGGNETATWKQIVRDNYPEYRNILSG